MFNYFLYIIIINRNVLFNAIVTRMKKYLIILLYFYIIFIQLSSQYEPFIIIIFLQSSE